MCLYTFPLGFASSLLEALCHRVVHLASVSRRSFLRVSGEGSSASKKG